MEDHRIMYDEEMVGAGHPAKADTLNRLALTEHNPDGTHRDTNVYPDFLTKGPWVDVRAFGAADDGTDDSEAIQDAIDHIESLGGGTVLLGHNHGIGSSIVIPVGVDVIGHGRGTTISILPGASLTGDFAILVNSTDGSGWTAPYAAAPCNRIGNFKIKNDNHATVTCRGMFVASGAEIFDIRTDNLHQTIKTTSQYLDLLTLRRIACMYSRGDDYPIEIDNLGDGLDISQVIFTGTGEWHSNTKGLSVKGCNGGQVGKLIAGKHQIVNSVGVVCSGWHSEAEDGVILTIDNSSVVLDGMYLWAGNAPRIKLVSTVDNQHTVSLRNVNFIVRHDEMPDSYDWYDLQTHPNFLVTVENCGKLATKIGNIALADVGGMLVKDSTGAALSSWNNYSHLLSKRGVIGYRETPELDHAFDCGSGNIFVVSAIQTNVAVTWGEATGTYYYRCQLLYDPVRMVGVSDSGSESSLALIEDGNGVLITITFGIRKRNAILRVYRGTTTNTYDKYADIPLLAIERLYDDGTYVNGYPWQERSAGAVDTLFADPVSIKWAGALLEMRGAASDPTAGTWKAADIIYAGAPTPGGKIGRVCVTAGTPGTWKPWGGIDA
ncbi:MAG: hypothetical protein QY316_04570 [Thermodesulfobacteriota bacterium]|nr:MAG: hypothetical protein QY316_04570 [Thermodesulfobacteriota bacterium]